MKFKEIKEIKDKKDEIKNIKEKINKKLNECSNKYYIIFYYILDNIENNIEIDKDSLLSNYDFLESTYNESKKYILNNINFMFEISENIGFSIIDFNHIENCFVEFICKLNDYIINKLDLYENIDLNDFNYDIIEIKKMIENDELNYIDYIDYLEKIYNFYDSFYDTMDFMINRYDLD